MIRPRLEELGFRFCGYRHYVMVFKKHYSNGIINIIHIPEKVINSDVLLDIINTEDTPQCAKDGQNQDYIPPAEIIQQPDENSGFKQDVAEMGEQMEAADNQDKTEREQETAQNEQDANRLFSEAQMQTQADTTTTTTTTSPAKAVRNRGRRKK